MSSLSAHDSLKPLGIAPPLIFQAKDAENASAPV